METDWRNLESETLCAIFDKITNLDNVLDYGCGSGWADVYLIKNGSDRVTAVDVSENGIISAKLKRVCKKGGQVIIGMNPYFEREMFSNRENIIFEGAYMYVDGILPINNHTDEEWLERIKKYFTVEKVEYYRMNQEKEGVKRRLFFLRA